MKICILLFKVQFMGLLLWYASVRATPRGTKTLRSLAVSAPGKAFGVPPGPECNPSSCTTVHQWQTIFSKTDHLLGGDLEIREG